MVDAKQIALRIFRETLSNIDIPLAFERRVSRSGNRIVVDDWSCDLSKFADMKLVALGKATHAMLQGFAQLFPEFRFTGVASAPTPPTDALPGISYFTGGHPLPSEQSFLAGKAALELLQGCTKNSLVIFLLSGGGSALMEVPADARQSLEDIRSLNQVLVTCGASIDEINAIRKHFSAIKGGRLALAAEKATKVTFAISDVPLGKESALASGPTIPDPTTCADVSRIIARYNLLEKLPSSARDWFASSSLPETPKKNHPAFVNSHFFTLLTSHDLFHAAHHAAEADGFITCCDNSTDDWPLDRAADFLLSQLEYLRRSNPGQRVAVISDGEVSSAVMGQGIGGRNSAFVLACVERIGGKPIAVLSAGTDGIDGNSPAAGAIADGTTFSRARELKLSPQDFFARSDSLTFFQKLGDSIVTGPTGNNLRDLRVLLAIPQK